MKFTEIFRGTDEEHSIQAQAALVSQKKRPNPRDREIIAEANAVSRRVFLRRAGVATAGVIALGVLGTGAVILTDPKKREENEVSEDVYNHYLEGFRMVAQGNAQAQKQLEFFLERRKRGFMNSRGEIVADESSDPGKVNFYTAVVNKNRNPREFDTMPGFAVYNGNNRLPTLGLKDVPVEINWAGILLGHESTHVYQGLKGIEQEREFGFLDGEIDAYELEFDLLQSLSGGHFKQQIKALSDGIEEGSHGLVRGILTPEEYDKVDQFFLPALSLDEEGLRAGSYFIAANFALIDRQEDNHSNRMQAKRDFINLTMQGVFGTIPGVGVA